MQNKANSNNYLSTTSVLKKIKKITKFSDLKKNGNSPFVRSNEPGEHQAKPHNNIEKDLDSPIWGLHPNDFLK